MDEHMHDGPGMDSHAEPPAGRPAVTFMGNAYDLTALGALVTGLMLAFICLTCNMGLYCLPFIPIGAGVVGLITARQAVNQERTQVWSWLGVGIGGVFLLLMAAVIVAYIGFFVLAIIVSGEFG